MIVADFGAGSGAHVFPLAEAVGESGRVYAIDVQRDLLVRIKNEANRRKHHHVDVLWGDLENLGGSKIADNVVDIVFLSNVLFQLKDKHTSLMEARRVLKPSGMFAIIERDSSVRGLHRAHSIPRDDVFAFARMADFEPVREFPAGTHHYGIIFRPVARTLS